VADLFKFHSRVYVLLCYHSPDGATTEQTQRHLFEYVFVIAYFKKVVFWMGCI